MIEVRLSFDDFAHHQFNTKSDIDIFLQDLGILFSYLEDFTAGVWILTFENDEEFVAFKLKYL